MKSSPSGAPFIAASSSLSLSFCTVAGSFALVGSSVSSVGLASMVGWDSTVADLRSPEAMVESDGDFSGPPSSPPPNSFPAPVLSVQPLLALNQ